ncbi:hypothetical protein BT93_F2869 [Corymbia citriodora subsp. variegata]|nr:hypothetical protein BT93_F2869 [Corymbia citriodora subsp. variegata]
MAMLVLSRFALCISSTGVYLMGSNQLASCASHKFRVSGFTLWLLRDFVTAISYLGLSYLTAIFLYRSIVRRALFSGDPGTTMKGNIRGREIMG